MATDVITAFGWAGYCPAVTTIRRIPTFLIITTDFRGLATVVSAAFLIAGYCQAVTALGRIPTYTITTVFIILATDVIAALGWAGCCPAVTTLFTHRAFSTTAFTGSTAIWRFIDIKTYFSVLRTTNNTLCGESSFKTRVSS